MREIGHHGKKKHADRAASCDDEEMKHKEEKKKSEELGSRLSGGHCVRTQRRDGDNEDVVAL